MINALGDTGLNNIKVVLIETSHPGNIGSTARALKTMGLSNLCLVKPKSFPDKQANVMASNAADLLDAVTVVGSLQAAIADCHMVIGSSARHERSLSWDVFDSRRCGELVAETLTKSKLVKVALVFGRERTGLNNEELSYCHHLVHIPTNPEYSSLNLASAVQILAYECRVALLASEKGPINNHASEIMDVFNEEEIVTTKDMQGYYDQLQDLMVETGFLDPEEPRLLMPRLRRLYGRLHIRRSELNILRGILSAFQKAISKR